METYLLVAIVAVVLIYFLFLRNRAPAERTGHGLKGEAGRDRQASRRPGLGAAPADKVSGKAAVDDERAAGRGAAPGRAAAAEAAAPLGAAAQKALADDKAKRPPGAAPPWGRRGALRANVNTGVGTVTG